MFRKAAKPSTPNAAAASITDTAPCQKSVRLHVGREVIAPVRAAVAAEFQREASLPGFRKGKAPPALIERQYAQAIQEEALRRVMKTAFEQAVQEHDLKPVGPFEVRRSDYSEADGLVLEATVEVEPAFSLGEYTQIPLARPSADVNPEEMARALRQLQESMAQLVPTPEGISKERNVPPLDDELAKDLGLENLEKLREHVGAKLREQRRLAQARALEASLCDELLRRHPFEIPPRLLSHQTERLTREFTARLLLSGMAEAQVKEETAKFTSELRTSAERHVKLTFILERIAEREGVAVSQDDLMGRLWQLAKRWKKDPAEVRKIFDAQDLWSSVVSTIRQEKTVAWLLAAAAIENGATGQGATRSLNMMVEGS